MRAFALAIRIGKSTQVPEKVLLQNHNGRCSCNIGERNFSQQQSAQIKTLLDRVREKDGLKPVQPHIEYLIGRASSGSAATSTDSSAESSSSGLDIADKTQLILQSPHPVRYIVEREIKKLEANGPTHVSYHDWVTIFGRSLGVTREMTRDKSIRFEERLDTISNAAECGMFSSDIHQTIVNIPVDTQDSKLLTQFNMGNKYAVLVGDYFAIKTIFFAERAKSSAVILAITSGVEEFTSAPFSSDLVDQTIWYPFIPASRLTHHNWESYNVKAPGYFTGGLNAVLTVCPNQLDTDPNFRRKMQRFVPNLNLLLKGLAEIDDFESEDHMMPSPFLFTSLPTILYQEKNPSVFEYFRTKYLESGKGNLKFRDDKELLMLKEEIEKSDAMAKAKELLYGYARNSKDALVHIGTDLFYVSVFHELIDLLTKSVLDAKK